MAKVNDARANPTPRFSPIRYSEYIQDMRKVFYRLTFDFKEATEHAAQIEKDLEKVTDELNNTLWLENTAARKAFDVATNNKDEDYEYQNVVDNQMAHDTE